MCKIRFETNCDKAVNALLYLLTKYGAMDVYQVMKTFWSAECYHLNKYGRPVYGDEYQAWDHGTVPQFMYHYTKLTKDVPFVRKENTLYALKQPDLSLFSESDLEALDYGHRQYQGLSFTEIRDKNHAEPAFKKAVANPNGNQVIPYEDMIQNPDVRAELLELGDMTLQMVL